MKQFEKTKFYKNILQKVAIVLLGGILLTGGGVGAYYIIQYNTNTKEYYAENQLGYINQDLENAIKSEEYIQKVNMNYQYCNSIGMKINYIIMSDFNLNILFDFNFQYGVPEELSLPSLKDLNIIDENNNILFKSNSYIDGYSREVVQRTKNNIQIWYKIRSTEGFPKSKMLNVNFKTIFGNGYTQYTHTHNGDWKLKINLLEKFYNRQSIKYHLKEENSYLGIEKAVVTDTTMRLQYRIIDNKIRSSDVKIIDENGNKYACNVIDEGALLYNDEGNIQKFTATFPVTLKNATNTLIIDIQNGKYQFVIEKE